MEFTYLTAFVVGLLGGVHCIGMCGGIVGALTFGLPERQRARIGALLPYQLAYNLGRVVSYVAAGAIMGGLGMLIAEFMPVYYAQRVLLAVAGIFMIMLGLYLSGWWLVLNRLESAGSRLWRLIEPISRRLLPVRTPGQALLVGMIWGWIPCGLVYSMLVTAVSAGSALQGAAVMLAFALGTLPTLMSIGLLAGVAARLSRSPAVRSVAGALVMLFGVLTIVRALQ
ncbi:MAG: sulfite exporter TauE/SafE family protein [Gammaproteobacteria bacterium]|nr:sulfite exporter TauE/SafE family protein [Gammaproteobacteria bacterium]MCB1878736.1 sulfite exporter TauE/SafE family protein [Gammaproteobacteria bacterium]MCB1902617.1 sulfite exporter TauE/SafE family protein [Gammaproteobacteria bacterium]